MKKGIVCPSCGCEQTSVVDSRGTLKNSIRRRRDCDACHFRFSTYEFSMHLDMEKQNKLNNKVKNQYNNVLKETKRLMILLTQASTEAIVNTTIEGGKQ